MAGKKRKIDSPVLKVKELYALVVYTKTGKSAAKKKCARGSEVAETFFDVLELSKIPKNHRVVGDKARVTWVDAATNKNSCHYVIIKKISDNRDELLKMCTIDASTEEIVCPQTKIFAAAIISEKKDKASEKKAEKVACLNARSKVEEAIFDDPGIWNDASMNPTPSPTPRTEITEPATLDPSKEQVSEQGPTTNENQADETDPGPTHESIIKNEVIELRHDRFWTSMKELAAVATPQNVAFLESVVSSMKAPLTPLEEYSSSEGKKLYEIPERFTTPGINKVPIFEGIPFYLFSGVKTAIETKSTTNNVHTRQRTKNWRILVRQCLVEVYGNNLTQFSAKGMKEGHRPAINVDLFKGLLYWAREWSEDEIADEDYIRLVNKTAYNKRKAVTQRNKKDNEKEKQGEIEGTNEGSDESKRGATTERESGKKKQEARIEEKNGKEKQEGRIEENKKEKPERRIEEKKEESSGKKQRTEIEEKNEESGEKKQGAENENAKQINKSPENFGNVDNNQHHQHSWSSLPPTIWAPQNNVQPIGHYQQSYYGDPYYSVPFSAPIQSPTQPQSSSTPKYMEI